MPVFKAYFKIIKQNLTGTLIYFVVFLAISILASTSSSRTDLNQNFEDIPVKVAIINQDKSTVLTEGIRDLLGDNNELVEVEHSEEAIREKLFYRHIEYAVVIPEGFFDSYLTGDAKEIISYRVPDSYASIYLDMTVNQFLNNVRVYDHFNEQQLGESVRQALHNVRQDTKVNLETEVKTAGLTRMDYYSMYTSYVILSAILLCVTTFMVMFNHSEVRQRTDCSPLAPIKVETQIIFGNIVLGFLTVAVLIITAIGLYQKEALTMQSMLYYGIMFAYALMSIALAFLISNFAKEKNVLSALATTLSLVFAFLGGTFIPLSMQSDHVKFVGSFTPTYWFTQACDYITTITDYSMENLLPYFKYMGIIILFAIAFLAIGLLVRRTKKLQYS